MRQSILVLTLFFGGCVSSPAEDDFAGNYRTGWSGDDDVVNVTPENLQPGARQCRSGWVPWCDRRQAGKECACVPESQLDDRHQQVLRRQAGAERGLRQQRRN